PPINHLCDHIALKLFRKSVSEHSALLASKITKQGVYKSRGYSGTLFYLDPPYWGNENDYGKDLFSRGDFAAMSEVLSTIPGHFIMSLNDLPEVRETFQNFDIEAVKTTYTIASKSAKKVGEVIISN
ncbi:MAG: hypothetical protein GQ535_15255, partial [Rhodobacteraceae bacterium]|nr:hypothetical protein [Paracoccaceae bacterium]